MPKLISLLSILFFISTFNLFAQLKGGPMQSYVAENEVSFWFMIDKSDTLKLEIWNVATNKISETKEILPDASFCYKNDCAITSKFRKLNADTKYSLEVYINGNFETEQKFTTKLSEKTNKDFSILTGSCGFIPFSWGKFLFPFHSLKIYKTMQKTQAAFMLWLGDTVYFINDDDKERKVRRNIKYRQQSKLNDFLTSKPQIAMWDDHDYGPNNADGNYEDKEASLAVFNQFWVNPKSIMKDGSYFKISHEDVDFFILDNRSYSTEPYANNATILGDKQKSWLKRNLKKSKATFKIICSGNQFIADYLSDKTFALYPKERTEIFNYLEKNKIEGVLFLTGDRHHSEMMKKEVEGLYTMYEFSSSPITSWTNKKINSMRFNKNQRIEGTLVNKRNFGKMSFIGAENKRKCIIETIDAKGNVLWTFVIDEQELKFQQK